MTLYQDINNLITIAPKANIASLSCSDPIAFKEFCGEGRAFGCYTNPQSDVPDKMVFVKADSSLIRFTRQSFQLVMCMEKQVEVATKMLQNDGLLIAISTVIDEARWLLYRRNYAEFDIYRAGNWLVVIAKRKTHLDAEYESKLDTYKAEFAGHDTNYPELANVTKRYNVRAGTRFPEFYIDGDLPDVTTSVKKFFVYGKHQKVKRLPQPLMPPSLGHLPQLLGMGALDESVLELDGKSYLIRGMTVKVEKGGNIANVPQFSIMDEDGNVQYLNKPMELVDFIIANPNGLRDAINEVMKPQYDMTIEPEWGNVFDTIQVNGQELLKTQELVISAMTERLLLSRYGFVIGEPGIGKTISAITIAFLLHQFALYGRDYPLLVESLCNRYGVTPSQLRGIKAGSINIVYTPANLPQQWADEFSSALGDDVYAKLITKPSELFDIANRAKAFPKTLHVAVMTYETLKLSDGIEYSFVTRHDLNRERKKVKAERGDNGIIRYVTDPITGNILRDGNGDRTSIARMSGKPKKRFYVGQFTTGEYVGLKRRKNGNGDFVVPAVFDVNTRPITRTHGHALWQQKRSVASVKRGEDKQPILGGSVFSKKGVTPKKAYKLALAEVIKRLDNVGMVIVDEAHRIKNGDSMAGQAVRKTFRKAQKIMLVTATFSSGTAESFFHLVYPLVKELRDKYAHNGAYSFAQDYGNVTKDGKVLAGISPEALRYIIDATVFVGLEDLGEGVLPELREEIVPVEANLEQEGLYDQLTNEITHYAQRQTGLTIWGLLFWAQSSVLDQCHLPEIVYEHRQRKKGTNEFEVLKRFVYEGLGEEPNPKDIKTVDLVMETLGRGERALVFCTQSDTRSILEKLHKLLADAGAKPFILRSQTLPLERHALMKKHVDEGYNVLIANPKIVQEGLNLIDFTDIIYYDVDTSVTVMIQSSRRTYRLSQKSPLVKISYLAYDNTKQIDRVFTIAKRSAAMRAFQGSVASDFDTEYVDSEGYGALGRSLAKAISAKDVNDAFEEGQFTFGYAQSIFNTPHNRKDYVEHRIVVKELEDEEGNEE